MTPSTTSLVAPGRSDADNARALSGDARREVLWHAALLAPSLVIVAVAVVAPVGWLFWLSVFDANGALSLENYARIAHGGLYLAVFETTFLVSLSTGTACALLGVPLAYFMCKLRPSMASLVLLAVLLPFWTSLLVRTYAWLVLLGRNGVLNNLLLSARLIDAPAPLVYNLLGTVIGMTHVMLPVFVLPTYSAMKKVDPDLIRAAASLGSSARRAFWQIFIPLSSGGIAAGFVLVTVFSLGFYVTPAILGGGKVLMVSMRIERSVSTFHNWGAASALGVVLLAALVCLAGLAYGLRIAARAILARGGGHRA